jgi:type II secretion system (T2SS) protein B
MSYILDALTKAAQQRERQVPVVQRLLSAAPTQRAAWARVPRRLPAALAVGVSLLAVALVWWLRSTPSPAPPEPARTLSASAPRAPSVETARPIRVEPLPRPGIPAEKRAPVERETSAVTPVVTAKPQVPPAPAPATRSPAAVVRPSPAPSSATAAPPTPAAPAPPTPAERAGLKLEALIYSDVPAQRMVFINGRRYAEGDTVDGRLRVEEIQEDGVALSDQGRRFTLRVSR